MLEVHEEGVQNAALGIDARSGHSLEELAQVLDHMKEAGYDFEILFDGCRRFRAGKAL